MEKENERLTASDWEERGRRDLGKVLDSLFSSSSKLSIASDHYIDSYQGDDLPGVSSSLKARIDSAQSYRDNISGSDHIAYMVKSAKELSENVGEKLAIIRNLAEHSGLQKQIGDVSEEALSSLELLFVATDKDKYDSAATELTKYLKDGINSVRDGANSGKEAAEAVTTESSDADFGFEKWWKGNYNNSVANIMSDHQHSLRSFAETAKDRERIYESATKSVLSDLPEDADDPVKSFINDYRDFKFPGQSS